MSDEFGIARLLRELRTLGYTVDEVKAPSGEPYVVFSDYEIVSGRFGGRIVSLAVVGTPDYPNSVHSSIHVKAVPQLYENQNVPNVRNVVDSALGGEWKYWSNNFNWNVEDQKTARRLMAKINTIFENA